MELLQAESSSVITEQLDENNSIISNDELNLGLSYQDSDDSANDISQLRQRFRNLIGEELEQLDEKWQHLAKEKVDQLVNCAYSKKENAEKIVLKALNDVWDWNVCHFKELPHWLQENDYLLFGHRPELGSFKSCFKSMFKLHTG